MFVNLNEEEKEKRFDGLVQYASKIRNQDLRTVCTKILTDYKDKLFCRGAGHDGIEGVKCMRTHQCFDGGLLDHIYNVTKLAYAIGLNYQKHIDMDLVLAGAILHDIGKTRIFDEWNGDGEVKSNLNYSYLLVDHLYIGEKIVEEYLDEAKIPEKFKYQILHVIATHMDTMDKCMAEAYIVSYADSIDADVENIISYPRDTVNPLYGKYLYESANPEQ